MLVLKMAKNGFILLSGVGHIFELRKDHVRLAATSSSGTQ
jgi:hypothetical protein